MTDDDYDALSQKQLASIKRDMRISLEDAAVRATYKVMAELAQPEQEPVAMKFKIYKPTVPDPMRQDINDALLPWVYDQSRDSGFVASMWVTPVSTLPPQRTWVGLTMQDVKVIEDNAPSIQMAIFMTEATLKDKNHGNS